MNRDANPERDALIAKIHKLRALSECAGASEHEAALAAKKMADLIAEFNVTQDELALRRDAKGCVGDVLYTMNSERADWHRVAGTVANLFAVRCSSSIAPVDLDGLGIKTRVVMMRWFGYPQDVAAAKALFQLIELAVVTSVRQFVRSPRNRKHKDSFELGMADRLRVRLQELQPRVELSQGKGLIVLKGQLVDAEYAEWLKQEGVRIRPAERVSTGEINRTAFERGAAAANTVSLGRDRLS